jgi:hypothetical protein
MVPNRVSVCFAVQRALLGYVTRAMKEATVYWNSRRIDVVILVDRANDEDTEYVVDAIEGEIVGEFYPDAEARVWTVVDGEMPDELERELQGREMVVIFARFPGRN